LYQKLLKSDNCCWNYRWWLGGILFWDTVYNELYSSRPEGPHPRFWPKGQKAGMGFLGRGS